MSRLGKKYALGLDIGQAAVKAVLVSRKGRTVTLEDSRILDLRAEGMIDEAELYRELRPWLEKQGWHHYEVTANIPQYVATTQVTDFPPGHGKNLDEMVNFETQQLAGLSEEAFLHDYHPIAPKFGRHNPVLIGICRESVIEERADSLQDTGITISDFTISGTALTAAYFHLYPKATETDTPQLLLDIGAENTTAAIVAGGNLLYSASLMCGTDRYERLVAQQLGITAEQAAETRYRHPLNPVDKDSPTTAAAHIFKSEILNTVEQWRADEKPEIGRIQFSKACICGGGASIKGLDKYLGSLIDCPTEIIGVKNPQHDQLDPQLVIAYGLALQGMDASPIPISLAPPAIKRRVHHLRRFPYLAAAIILFAAFTTLMGGRHYLDLQKRETELNILEKKLARSDKIIPKLEEINYKTTLFERILAPYAEKCNHASQLRRTINQLGKARRQVKSTKKTGGRRHIMDSWVIYLADENTFHAGKKDYPANSNNESASEARTGMTLTMAAASENDEKPSGDATSRTIDLTVNDIAPWKSFVAAIYAAQPPDHPLGKVRALTDALSASKVFQNSIDDRVDIFQDKDTRGREDIFRPWLNSRISRRNYRRAVIRLPLSKDLMVLNPPPEQKEEDNNQ
ncbi:MAG: pilus assembly protein PilM [Lentisphaeria bacterium]